MAFGSLEMICPEFQDATLLMRVAHLCLNRSGLGETDKDQCARKHMVYVFDALRVNRMIGECSDESAYTVKSVTGQEKKNPAMVHYLFKKKDIVEYVSHEVSLLGIGSEVMSKFASLIALVQNFTASGALVTAHLKGGDADAPDGIENTLAVVVAEYRDKDTHDVKTQALIDFIWPVWKGSFDEEIAELCAAELQGNNPVFRWHEYFKTSNTDMTMRYRAFVDACMAGPINTECPG